MIDLTQYKDIFGKPGEGIHFHVAIVDILLTIGLGYLLGKVFKRSPWGFILLLFVLGEFLHYIFGVNSAFWKLFK